MLMDSRSPTPKWMKILLHYKLKRFISTEPSLAECVTAGIRVCAGGVAGHDGVGVVCTGAASTGDGENTTNSKGGGAAAQRQPALRAALRRCVASSSNKKIYKNISLF